MNSNALYFSRKVLYRQAVLLVPIISVFVVVVLTLYEAHRYRELGRELTVTKRQITQLDTLIKDPGCQAANHRGSGYPAVAGFEQPGLYRCASIPS